MRNIQAIDGAFNGIELICANYNEEMISVGSYNSAYASAPGDVNYLAIKINSVKANINVVCTYNIQRFPVDVYICITDDGFYKLLK